MIDYSYYVNTFKGTLDEETFNRFINKSISEVKADILGRDYVGFETEFNNTCCEVVDVYAKQQEYKDKLSSTMLNEDRLVSSESVGDYSKSYSNISTNDLKELASEDYTQSLINDILRRNLLITGLLNRGIKCV